MNPADPFVKQNFSAGELSVVGGWVWASVWVIIVLVGLF